MRLESGHAEVDVTIQKRKGNVVVVVCYGAATVIGGILVMNLMWSCQVSGSVTIYSNDLLNTDIVIANSGVYEVFPRGVNVGEIRELKNTGWFSRSLSCCFELVLLPRFILSWRE